MADANMRSLAMEALLLSEQLAKMDRQIEQAIATPKSELRDFLEKKVFDAATIFALIKIFGALLKSTGAVSIPTRAAVSIFSSTRQPTARMAYFDTRPELAEDYYKKTQRLAQIHLELFSSMPPSPASLNMDNICAKEACFRSPGALK